MPPDPSQERQRREREALHPSTGELHARSYLRHLVPPERTLRSTLELLQSYQTVLQADKNLARLFEVPLASDLKAERLQSLFTEKNPRVLEADQARCTIHWADVVLSLTYESEQQTDGNYHVRVDKGKVEVST